MSTQPVQDNALLDYVKAMLGAPSDTALARLLGVPQPAISKVRGMVSGVTPRLQLAMLDAGISLSLIRQYVPAYRHTPKVGP